MGVFGRARLKPANVSSKEKGLGPIEQNQDFVFDAQEPREISRTPKEERRFAFGLQALHAGDSRVVTHISQHPVVVIFEGFR